MDAYLEQQRLEQEALYQQMLASLNQEQLTNLNGLLYIPLNTRVAIPKSSLMADGYLTFPEFITKFLIAGGIAFPVIDLRDPDYIYLTYLA